MPLRPSFFDQDTTKLLDEARFGQRLDDAVSGIRAPSLLDRAIKSVRLNAYGDENATSWQPAPIIVSDRPDALQIGRQLQGGASSAMPAVRDRAPETPSVPQFRSEDFSHEGGQSAYKPPAMAGTPSAMPTGGGGAVQRGNPEAGVEQWNNLVQEAAQMYGADPADLKGLMEIESGGRTHDANGKPLRSSAGAIGLMQTMPFHYQAGEDPDDPRTNIMRGAKIYADNLRRYGGDRDKAAAAYFGAIDNQGNVTSATDGSAVDGHAYVRLFRNAAAKYSGGASAPTAGARPTAPAAPQAPAAAPLPAVAGAQGLEGSGPIRVRDHWGNEWQTTQEALNRRPGGYSDLTILSRDMQKAAPEDMPLDGGPSAGDQKRERLAQAASGTPQPMPEVGNTDDAPEPTDPRRFIPTRNIVPWNGAATRGVNMEPSYERPETRNRPVPGIVHEGPEEPTWFPDEPSDGEVWAPGTIDEINSRRPPQPTLWDQLPTRPGDGFEGRPMPGTTDPNQYPITRNPDGTPRPPQTNDDGANQGLSDPIQYRQSLQTDDTGMWSPDAPAEAGPVSQMGAGRMNGGVYSRPTLPTDPEASTGAPYDPDSGPRETGYTVPPDPSGYGASGDDPGYANNPSDQANVGIIPQSAPISTNPQILSDEKRNAPADDPGGAGFAAQDAYSTPAPQPSQQDEYLDLSVPSPPGWQAMVDGAGNVVRWVREKGQQASSAAYEGLRPLREAAASLDGPGGYGQVQANAGEPDYVSQGGSVARALTTPIKPPERPKPLVGPYDLGNEQAFPTQESRNRFTRDQASADAAAIPYQAAEAGRQSVEEAARAFADALRAGERGDRLAAVGNGLWSALQVAGLPWTAAEKLVTAMLPEANIGGVGAGVITSVPDLVKLAASGVNGLQRVLQPDTMAVIADAPGNTVRGAQRIGSRIGSALDSAAPRMPAPGEMQLGSGFVPDAGRGDTIGRGGTPMDADALVFGDQRILENPRDSQIANKVKKIADAAGRSPFEMTPDELYQVGLADAVVAHERWRNKIPARSGRRYYHVADPSYQDGEPIMSFADLRGQGREVPNKWEDDFPDYPNSTDARAVTFAESYAAAHAFNEDFLGGGGVILAVDVPRGVRLRRNGEGYVMKPGSVPPEWIARPGQTGTTAVEPPGGTPRTADDGVRMLGSGVVPQGNPYDAQALTRSHVVPPDVAESIPGGTRIPVDPTLEAAVSNTPGARITDAGLEMDVQRFQKPVDAGREPSSGGVFYAPDSGRRGVGAYRFTEEPDYPVTYGGPQEIAGPTTLRRPFVEYNTPANGGNSRYTLELLAEEAGRTPEQASEMVSDFTALGRRGFSEDAYNARARRWGLPEMQPGRGVPELRVYEGLRAALAREAGYDSVVRVGGPSGKSKILEIHDLREATYPTPEGGYSLRPEFQSSQSAGSGVVPGLRAPLANAAQGAAFGATSEEIQAQQEGRETDRGEQIRRGLGGAGLAMFAGNRTARNIVGRAVTGSRGVAGRGAEGAGQRVGSGVIPDEYGRAYPPIRGSVNDLVRHQLGDESAEMLADSRFPRDRVPPDMQASIGPVDDAPRTYSLGSGFVPADDAAPNVGRMRRQPGKTFAFGAKPGERLEFNVRVVPLSSLITSHTDSLGINPAFPRELQPRVRERAASRVQIDRIVKEFDPDQLIVDTHRVDSGPMIVGPDMVVESGNGRSIALRRLAQEDPDGYAAYVQALKDELPRYGLADDVLDGIDQPVLVRERVTDVDRVKFAADANVGVQARMAPVEQAMQDAGRVSDDAVTRIVVGEDQTIDEALMSAENGAFRRAFMATIPENEWGELLTADGNLNPTGLARVKNALLAKTYHGSAGARLATVFVDSLDSGIKNVQHGIMGSLPTLSRVEARIATGEIDAGLSIADDMAMAADVYTRLRRRSSKNKSMLSDYLAQSGMFEGRETTPFQDKILAYLDENARSPKRIRALLDEYARTVDGMAGAEQVDMFGMPIPQMTKDEVLDDVLRRLGADPDQGADLGRAGAGSDFVEGPVTPAPPVSDPPAGLAASGSAGSGAATPQGPQLSPEEQLARFQRASGQPSPAPRPDPTVAAPLRDANLPPVADDLLPGGGPEGALTGMEDPAADLSSQARSRVKGATPAQARKAQAEMRRRGGDYLPDMDDPLRPSGREIPPYEARSVITGAPIDEVLPGIIKSLTRPAETGARAANGAAEMRATGSAGLPGTIENPGVGARISSALESVGRRIGILRYAGMLSDTAGHGMNIAGGGLLSLADLATTPIAAAIDVGRVGMQRAAGRQAQREVFFSEVPARLRGMRAGVSVGLRDAVDILRTGLRPDEATKLDQGGVGFASGSGKVDAAVEGPLRALAAADAVFRSSATGGHLMAEATAAATKANGGKAPTPEMVRQAAKDPDLLERVQNMAARTVLQEDRRLTTWYRRAMNDAPLLLRAIASVEAPFVRTPYNIVAQGVGLTPAALAGVVNDMAKGKPARGLEHNIARAALGTAVMAWAFSDYGNGTLTGPYPSDANERSTLPPGWQPWSRKVDFPDGTTRYIPLAYLGPFAIPAVTAIMAAETAKKGKEALSIDWAGQVAMGMGRYAEQNTFMEGLGAISKVFDERSGDANLERHVEQIVSQFSPHIIGGGALGREVQRVTGMPTRNPEGWAEALLATHPLTAGNVPPRQDVLGRPVVQAPGALSTVVRGNVDRDTPVIAAYRAAGEGLPMRAPKTIPDPNGRGTYVLSRDQQQRWQTEFGDELQQRWQRAGSTQNQKRLQEVERDARDAVNERMVRDLRGGPVVPAKGR